MLIKELALTIKEKTGNYARIILRPLPLFYQDISKEFFLLLFYQPSLITLRIKYLSA